MQPPSHGKGEYHGVAGLPLPQEQEQDQDDVDGGAKDDDGETGDVFRQFPVDVAHDRAGDSQAEEREAHLVCAEALGDVGLQRE